MKRIFTPLNKILIVIALLGNMMACGQSEVSSHRSSPTPTPQRYDYSTIELADRFTNKLETAKWDDVLGVDGMEFAPVYLGDIKPLVQLTYKPELTGNRIDLDDHIMGSPTDSTLFLTIDTNRIVGLPMSIWEYYKKPEYRRGIMAFPVFLENISNDTMDVGSGDLFTNIIVEAKNKDGQWQRLSHPYIFECGTDMKTIFLAPHQIAITAMPVCQGDFRTLLRLVFLLNDDKCLYSNVIEGFVDEEMLNPKKSTK